MNRKQDFSGSKNLLALTSSPVCFFLKKVNHKEWASLSRKGGLLHSMEEMRNLAACAIRKASLHYLQDCRETVISYVVLCRGQLSGEKDWLLQIKSLDFNPATSDTILCKFYQTFTDTVAYILSCARERQLSLENSEHLFSVCTVSESTFFHCLFFVWGDFFFSEEKILSQLM